MAQVSLGFAVPGRTTMRIMTPEEVARQCRHAAAAPLPGAGADRMPMGVCLSPLFPAAAARRGSGNDGGGRARQAGPAELFSWSQVASLTKPMAISSAPCFPYRD